MAGGSRVDDLAFATALQGLSARTLEDESGVITLAERITALQANIADVTATAIESLSTRVEMAEGRTEANAAAITSLVAEISLDPVTAAAFMELTARVTSTENVDGSTTLAGLAQWLVKTTVGDLTAGVGLYNDGTISRFTVAADRFMILPPDAQDDEDGLIPFAVVNGKVFINEAVIREASIGVAKIQNGFLTNLAAVHGTLGVRPDSQGRHLRPHDQQHSFNRSTMCREWRGGRSFGTGQPSSTPPPSGARLVRSTSTSDVQNVDILWRGSLTVNDHQVTAPFVLGGFAIDSYDAIILWIRNNQGSVDSHGTMSISTGQLASGTSATPPSSQDRIGFTVGIEESGSANGIIWRSSTGRTIYLRAGDSNENFTVFTILGVKNPVGGGPPDPDPLPPDDPDATTVTARAGADRSVQSGGSIGIGGTDTIANPVGSTTIAWTRQSGAGGTLSSTTIASPTFTAPTVASNRTIIWRKTVTNNGVSDSDDVTVTVTVGTPPPDTTTVTANAGSNVSVESGGSVGIGGTDTITNGSGTTTYAWTRQSGAGGTLSSTSVASPTFNAPTVTSDRDIVWRKTVMNNGVSDTDDVTITVDAPSPDTTTVSANAGADQNVVSGGSITIGGPDTITNGQGIDHLRLDPSERDRWHPILDDDREPDLLRSVGRVEPQHSLAQDGDQQWSERYGRRAGGCAAANG